MRIIPGFVMYGLVVLLAWWLGIIKLWSILLRSEGIIKSLYYPVLIFLCLLILGCLFRTGLWLFYRPLTNSHRREKAWPSVSIIMPAFNEEKNVARAVEAVMSSDYPPGNLELICVNDGSTDRTQEVLNRMKALYKNRLKVISLGKNQGKKKALAIGLKQATGDIIITTDADSEIHRQAIKNLILPLIQDARVGAVAGRVAVLNEKKNLFTRMLSAHYALAFDFGRAYQSVYGGVLCCPGALSAFRRSVLEQVMRPWLKQKFMKVKCRHGEDRALTSLVFKKGYLVKYQSNALVYTRVPEHLFQINRMYIRWTRSYVRETLLLFKYFWNSRNHRRFVLPVVDSGLQLLLHPFHLLAFSLILYSFIKYPSSIASQLAFLAALSLALGINQPRVGRNLRVLYGLSHSLFVFFFQWWMVPYSLITVKDQDWLTK